MPTPSIAFEIALGLDQSSMHESKRLYCPTVLDHNGLFFGQANDRIRQDMLASLWHLRPFKNAHVHGEAIIMKTEHTSKQNLQ